MSEKTETKDSSTADAFGWGSLITLIFIGVIAVAAWRTDIIAVEFTPSQTKTKDLGLKKSEIISDLRIKDGNTTKVISVFDDGQGTAYIPNWDKARLLAFLGNDKVVVSQKQVSQYYLKVNYTKKEAKQ